MIISFERPRMCRWPCSHRSPPRSPVRKPTVSQLSTPAASVGSVVALQSACRPGVRNLALAVGAPSTVSSNLGSIQATKPDPKDRRSSGLRLADRIPPWIRHHSPILDRERHRTLRPCPLPCRVKRRPPTNDTLAQRFGFSCVSPLFLGIGVASERARAICGNGDKGNHPRGQGLE